MNFQHGGHSSHFSRWPPVQEFSDQFSYFGYNMMLMILLVKFSHQTRQDEETAPVFKLAELAQLYHSQMEQLGVEIDNRIHSAQPKERLLAEFPDM